MFNGTDSQMPIVGGGGYLKSCLCKEYLVCMLEEIWTNWDLDKFVPLFSSGQTRVFPTAICVDLVDYFSKIWPPQSNDGSIWPGRDAPLQGASVTDLAHGVRP